MTDESAQVIADAALATEAAAAPAAPAATDAGAQTDSGAKPPEAGEAPATAKDGDEKPAKASEEIAPFELKLTLPDGVATDDARLEGFTGTITEFEKALAEAGGDRAKIREVITGMADKLVGAEAEAVEAVQQRQADMVEKWNETAKKDPDYGGARFEKSMGAVAAVRDRFGSKEFNALLDASGMGSHPEVIRFLHTISTKILETDPVGAGAATTAPPKTVADRLYG